MTQQFLLCSNIYLRFANFSHCKLNKLKMSVSKLLVMPDYLRRLFQSVLNWAWMCFIAYDYNLLFLKTWVRYFIFQNLYSVTFKRNLTPCFSFKDASSHIQEVLYGHEYKAIGRRCFLVWRTTLLDWKRQRASSAVTLHYRL